MRSGGVTSFAAAIAFLHTATASTVCSPLSPRSPVPKQPPGPRGPTHRRHPGPPLATPPRQTDNAPLLLPAVPPRPPRARPTRARRRAACRPAATSRRSSRRRAPWWRWGWRGAQHETQQQCIYDQLYMRISQAGCSELCNQKGISLTLQACAAALLAPPRLARPRPGAPGRPLRTPECARPGHNAASVSKASRRRAHALRSAHVSVSASAAGRAVAAACSARAHAPHLLPHFRVWVPLQKRRHQLE